MTVVQVPRTFLASLDEEERRSLLDDDARRLEQAESKAARYLEERGKRVVDPLITALTARGRPASVRLVEGDDPAQAIINTAQEVGADLIMMGATRRLFTEQAWTSISVQGHGKDPMPADTCARGPQLRTPARSPGWRPVRSNSNLSV